MSLVNIAEIADELKERLYYLERDREFAEKKGCTLLEIEVLDKEIEEMKKKLNEVMKIIEKRERQHRYDMRTCAEFEKLLERLGLKSNESIPLVGIDIAECLLAGYEMQGHSFYKLLHSEDPAEQKKAKKDVRILKRFINYCLRAQINY